MAVISNEQEIADATHPASPYYRSCCFRVDTFARILGVFGIISSGLPLLVQPSSSLPTLANLSDFLVCAAAFSMLCGLWLLRPLLLLPFMATIPMEAAMIILTAVRRWENIDGMFELAKLADPSGKFNVWIYAAFLALPAVQVLGKCYGFYVYVKAVKLVTLRSELRQKATVKGAIEQQNGKAASMSNGNAEVSRKEKKQN